MNSPIPGGFVYRRKCSRCRQHKPMAGGKTFPGGKIWHCGECRNERNEKRASAIPAEVA